MINQNKIKQEKKQRRHKMIRSKIVGSAKRPRLSVFRSNKYLFTQLINDEKGKTLISVRDSEIKDKKKAKNKVEQAFMIGKLLAEKAKKVNIEKVVFDKGEYKYHGRVKAVADGAREGGLNF